VHALQPVLGCEAAHGRLLQVAAAESKVLDEPGCPRTGVPADDETILVERSNARANVRAFRACCLEPENRYVLE
jgi:hypothetical protein